MDVWNSTYSPVLANCGQTELNRILSAAYSRAMDRVAAHTAALEPLYQVRLGLGLMAPVDAIWMKLPRLLFCFIHGTMTATDR